MAKKDKQTFASRAKALIKQYNRADFDPTEKAELDQKLSELSQEQEAYREANGINNDQKFQDGGPLQKMQPIPFLGFDTPVENLPDYTALAESSLPQAQGDGGQQNNLSPYSTSIIPSLVSGGASVLGNLLLADKAGRDVPQLRAQTLTPERISLGREREAAKRFKGRLPASGRELSLEESTSLSDYRKNLLNERLEKLTIGLTK